jgi:glycosyltransferase involved in cell wall biosynthesis
VLSVRLVGAGDHSGYAQLARYLVRALRGAGHAVAYVPFGRSCSRTPDVNVVCFPPTHFSRERVRGTLNLGYTMFEASRIRDEWVQDCDRMDGVLVPSAYCRTVFQDSGVRVPVRVVRPGVYAAAPSPQLSSLEYRFLSVFQWSSRKDPEALLQAYWHEFRADEQVVLCLKTYPFGAVSVDDEMARIRGSHRFSGHARVALVREVLDAEALWRLHQSADCYVSAHHAEGWGMSLVDAMACGKPVIATDYGGSTDFVLPEHSYPVPCSVGPIAGLEPALERYFGLPGMHWGSVYVDALRSAMRRVYTQRKEARLAGARARAHVLEHLTPAKTAAMFEAAVTEIRSC